MFSVVIPTMWRGHGIDVMLNIPEDFKIFLGDAWLFHHNRMAKRLSGRIMDLDVIMTRGTTSMGADMRNTWESDFAMRDIVYSRQQQPDPDFDSWT